MLVTNMREALGKTKLCIGAKYWYGNQNKYFITGTSLMIYSKSCGEYMVYVNTNLGHIFAPVKTGMFSLDGCVCNILRKQSNL